MRLPSMGWLMSGRRLRASQALQPTSAVSGSARWRRPCSVSARQSARLPASGSSGANLWKDSVELLAATAILGLSVGCGLTAARVALEGLFSLMTLHSSFHFSPNPLALEVAYEFQLRLTPPAA